MAKRNPLPPREGRFRRVLGRPTGDLLLACRVFGLLGWARLRIRRRGLAGVRPALGRTMAESPQTDSAGAVHHVERIRWAVGAASARTPWNSNCFPQAVVAKKLLDDRDLASTVYFGAAWGAPNPAQAPERVDAPTGTGQNLVGHAWVRCGTHLVIGGESADEYQPIVWYS